MSLRWSKKEGFYFYNYLSGLIKTLEGRYTTIDLQNESAVTGKIVYSDAMMNIDLEDAMFYDARGGETPFSSMFIRARNIRYIHIPNDIKISEAIKSIGATKKCIPHTTKKTFKQKRAIAKQQQTLIDLARVQKSN